MMVRSLFDRHGVMGARLVWSTLCGIYVIPVFIVAAVSGADTVAAALFPEVGFAARVSAMRGGDLRISSAPGRGTEVEGRL